MNAGQDTRGEIIAKSGVSPYANYFLPNMDTQSSARFYASDITLTKDSDYYLEILHYDKGIGRFGMAGVLIEGMASQNPVWEVRKYELVCPTEYETFTLTLTGKSGSVKLKMQGRGNDYSIFYTDNMN